MVFEKIYSHPDKKLIIKMLKNGVGVREVVKTLKELHPNDKKLHLTTPTIQSFRKEKLNIEGEVLTAIKDATAKKKEKKELSKLHKMPVFREAVEEAAKMHVDLRKELKEVLATIKFRIEDLYDKAISGNLSVNEESNLQKYLTSWTATLQQWAKYIDKIADKTIETNVNITVIEDQMVALRNAVRETIEEEMDNETAAKFMYKLSQKMSTLSYRQKKQESMSDLYNDALMISDSISEAEVENDD